MMASRRGLPRDSDSAGGYLGGGRAGREVTVINGRHPGLQPVAPYDFRRPSRFSKDHQRTLQQIHEQFAQGFATALSSFLRLNVRAQVTSVEQTAFEEYADSLSNPTIIYVIHIPRFDGPITVELPVEPTRIMLDRLCGGPGLPVAGIQRLTEIERSLLKPLGRTILPP